MINEQMAFLADLHQLEEEDKEQNRLARIANCGKFHRIFVDIKTHEAHAYRVRCKEWRYCDFCFQARVNEYRNRVLGAIWAGEDIKQVLVHESGWRALRDRIVSSGFDYLKFPLDKGYSMILSNDTIGQPLDKSSVEFFTDIVKTPKGKRISGKLGLQPISGPELVEAGVTNAPQEVICEVAEELSGKQPSVTTEHITIAPLDIGAFFDSLAALGYYVYVNKSYIQQLQTELSPPELSPVPT